MICYFKHSIHFVLYYLFQVSSYLSSYFLFQVSLSILPRHVQFSDQLRHQPGPCPRQEQPPTSSLSLLYARAGLHYGRVLICNAGTQKADFTLLGSQAPPSPPPPEWQRLL